MSKFFKGLLILLALALLVLLSGCNSQNAFSEFTESRATEIKLKRIDIVASPITTLGISELTLAKSNRQSFEAVGHFSDGSSQAFTDLSVLDWHSSDTDVGRFDVPGEIISLDEGTTTITATKDGVTSNTVSVNVSAAVIKEIQVTPAVVNVAKGQNYQLIATATYSDMTSSDISSSVMWTPLDATHVTVTSEGLLSGVEEGSTTVTATKDGVTSNTVNVNVSTAVIEAIQVTPAVVNVAKGQTYQLVATATYSDRTSSDVSSSVIWTLLDDTLATVTSGGLLSGIEEGSTTLMATKDQVTSNTVDVNVSAAVIEAIQVTPAVVNVAKGQTYQLVATAIYSDRTSSDVSSSVIWTLLDATHATVTSGGLLSGVEEGNTTVTATKDEVVSNTANVNVSEAVITEIQVSPSAVTIAKGETHQLVAIATYSDEMSSDVSGSVTWLRGDTAYATVTPDGLLSGIEVGSTTVTAIKDGVMSNTVDVTVCDLAGACIDIFDTGSGKLFTNSPSKAYLDSIGVTYADETFNEDGTFGPAGSFYLLNWTKANLLCDTYNTENIGGRHNWRLATKDELSAELFGVFGNMFTARGWPTTHDYWSETAEDSSNYYLVYLKSDHINYYPKSDKSYVSCVSEP